MKPVGLWNVIGAAQAESQVPVGGHQPVKACAEPVVDILVMDVENAVNALEEVEKTNSNIVFDPPWDKSKLSEEAKLELGLL